MTFEEYFQGKYGNVASHLHLVMVSIARDAWDAAKESADAVSSCTKSREYFETGCLCIISGKLAPSNVISDIAANDYYLQNCKCSRHPDHPANLSPDYVAP